MQNGRKSKSIFFIASRLWSFCYPLLPILAVYIVTAVILFYVFFFFVRTNRHSHPQPRHTHAHIRHRPSYVPPLPSPPPYVAPVPDDDIPFQVYSIFDPYVWGYANLSQSLPTPKPYFDPSNSTYPANLTQVAWYYSQPYSFRLGVANRCIDNMYRVLNGSDLLSELMQLTGFDFLRRKTPVLYVFDCFELLRERYIYGTNYTMQSNASLPHLRTEHEGDLASKGEYVQFNYTYRLYNHTAPPALPSSRQYVGRANILRAIAGHNNRMLEYIVDAGNGSAAAQDDDREVEASAGEVYVYAHNYAHPCFLRNISHKFVPSCGIDESIEDDFVKDLLVVAVQRSGTHYIWEMLNQLFINMHHEGIGHQGAVSWLYAINAHNTKSWNKLLTLDQHRYYGIDNPVKLAVHRFRYIFHQVRHPIRVITTLVNKCADFDRMWFWISSASGFESIRRTQTPLMRAMLLYYLWNRHMEMYADLRYVMERTSPRDVCLWSGFPLSHCTHTYRGEIKNPRSPKTHSSKKNGRLSWYSSWLREKHQSKSSSARSSGRRLAATTSSSALHNKTQLVWPAEKYYVPAANPVMLRAHTDIFRRKPNTAETVSNTLVSWNDMFKEDAVLAQKILSMCLEYHMPPDLRDLPQSEDTRRFHA